MKTPVVRVELRNLCAFRGDPRLPLIRVLQHNKHHLCVCVTRACLQQRASGLRSLASDRFQMMAARLALSLAWSAILSVGQQSSPTPRPWVVSLAAGTYSAGFSGAGLFDLQHQALHAISCISARCMLCRRTRDIGCTEWSMRPLPRRRRGLPDCELRPSRVDSLRVHHLCLPLGASPTKVTMPYDKSFQTAL